MDGLNHLGQRSRLKSGSLDLTDIANCVWIVQSVSISSAPWSVFSLFSRHCSVALQPPRREQKQWPHLDTLCPVVEPCLCRTCDVSEKRKVYRCSDHFHNHFTRNSCDQENTVIIYSLSSWKVFWRMWATRQSLVSIDLYSILFFSTNMQVNGDQKLFG